MSYNVALVGAGPTSIFCLQALISREHRPAGISIYERQRRAGLGTPYSANWSDPIMLANIASIEIPSLPQSLVDWLRAATDQRLDSFGISRETIDQRAFYPRLVLGEYLSAQFDALVRSGRAAGIDIKVYTQSTVSDVVIIDDAIKLTTTSPGNNASSSRFDYIILATGHQWPQDPEVRPGYFSSPWPASALARIRNCAVGIRGTALSAIDACVVLANQHGEFVQGDGEELQYRAQTGTERFSVTMFSRKGILPEADFYHPIPYEPLAVCTGEAIESMVRAGRDALLESAFELFHEELSLADAAYVEGLGPEADRLDGFCAAYFNRRADANPFEWARDNLAEAADNAARCRTVKWRYAILRMHEVFGLLAPHLDDHEYDRFSNTLKTVFVDNYATVPHQSIRRLLALHAAGKLEVRQLDGSVRLDTRSATNGAVLSVGGSRTHFPVFIDATGQRVLGAKDFPFPSLRRQGVIQDAKTDGDTPAKRGIAIDGDFHPVSAFESSQRLFCLSLPFLLGQHPFAQGITSSAEMADVVADAIGAAEVAMPRKIPDCTMPIARTDQVTGCLVSS